MMWWKIQELDVAGPTMANPGCRQYWSTYTTWVTLIHRFLSRFPWTSYRMVSRDVSDCWADIAHTMVPTTDQEAEVMQYICICFHIWKKRIGSIPSEQYGQETFRRSSWHFVQCLSLRLQDVIADLQEDARMKITDKLARIQVVNNLLNMRERDCQGWWDQNARQLITGHRIWSACISYSIPEGEEQINRIATTLMAANTLMLLSVVHGKSIDDGIWKERWWNSQDVIIYSNDITDTTREIFTWSARGFCWVNPQFNQQARLKWSDPNWSDFHWSDSEILSFVKNLKSGTILRFTV
jgi:hypothetical protein